MGTQWRAPPPWSFGAFWWAPRYDKGSDTYNLDFKVPKEKQDPKRRLTRAQLVDFWVEMSKKYPLVLLEDPFDENDFEGTPAEWFFLSFYLLFSRKAVSPFFG